MDIRRLAPHDPLPDGHARRVVLLRRFDEDRPRDTVIELHLSGGGALNEATRPNTPEGHPMSWDQAIAAAQSVAESEGLGAFYVLDRTAGDREQDILQHAGDRTVHMEELSDTDPEDGEVGPDMRDRRP